MQRVIPLEFTVSWADDIQKRFSDLVKCEMLRFESVNFFLFFLVSVYNRLEVRLEIVSQFIFSEPFKSNINTWAYCFLIIIDSDSRTHDIRMVVQVNQVSNHATHFWNQVMLSYIIDIELKNVWINKFFYRFL